MPPITARLSLGVVATVVTMLGASCGEDGTSGTTGTADSSIAASAPQTSRTTDGDLPAEETSIPVSSSPGDGEVIFDPTLLGALGDCLNQGEDALVAVACAQPHDYQLVLADGLFEAPIAAGYPTDEEWVGWEDQFCAPAIESFAGLPIADDVGITTFRPTEESWAEGDRAVWCAAYRGEAQWSGSLAD